MITIDSLTRKYGAFTAVDDVSFTAEPGRVTGFLGPNGAGKSTTMRVLVGLTESEAERRVRNYSLGMRQRLGIATALIGDPQVLILDEPANGLDPAGIRWMRDLLRGFADQGGTVLLSSHLLHEIEVIADDIVVIGQGRIVAQGSKSELLAAAGTLVRTSDPDRLARALHEAAVVTGTLATCSCVPCVKARSAVRQ